MVLEEVGLRPEHLELEIKEAALLRDFTASAATLGELKGLGTTLALDDFGNGGSSAISYLRHLPIDVIKLDRTLIQETAHPGTGQIVTLALTELAHSLAIKVVAEGIETPAELSFLRDAGCDVIQGHLVSPALDIDAMTAWLGHPLTVLPNEATPTIAPSSAPAQKEAPLNIAQRVTTNEEAPPPRAVEDFCASARGGTPVASTGRQIGDLTIARALEMIMPFDRQAFFPETTPADWAPYESWLKPKALDPATGALLFPIQSYVVRTAHHTDPDRYLRRQSQGAGQSPRSGTRRPTTPTCARSPGSGSRRRPSTTSCALTCTAITSAGTPGWSTAAGCRPSPTRATCSPKRSSRRGSGATRSFRVIRLEDSVLPVIAAGQARAGEQRLCPRRPGPARADARPHARPRRDLSRFARCPRGHVRRHHALAGAVPAPRVDGVARLGPGRGQAHPARVHGALLRYRHPDLHRALSRCRRPAGSSRTATPSGSRSTTRTGEATTLGADAPTQLIRIRNPAPASARSAWHQFVPLSATDREALLSSVSNRYRLEQLEPRCQPLFTCPGLVSRHRSSLRWVFGGREINWYPGGPRHP